jgi:hypothetical protein
MRTLTIHSMGAGEDLLCFLLSDPHWLALPLFGAQLSLIPKENGTEVVISGPELVINGVQRALDSDPFVLCLDEADTYQILGGWFVEMGEA